MASAPRPLHGCAATWRAVLCLPGLSCFLGSPPTNYFLSLFSVVLLPLASVVLGPHIPLVPPASMAAPSEAGGIGCQTPSLGQSACALSLANPEQRPSYWTRISWGNEKVALDGVQPSLVTGKTQRLRTGTAGASAGPAAGGLLGGGGTETKGHESGEGCSRAEEAESKGELEEKRNRARRVSEPPPPAALPSQGGPRSHTHLDQ